MTVAALRSNGWHAYEEDQVARAIRGVRTSVGAGATRPSGDIEKEQSNAPLFALAALLLMLALTGPSLYAGLRLRYDVPA